MARATGNAAAWLSAAGRRIGSVESAVAGETDMGLPVSEIDIVDERRATGRRRALQQMAAGFAPAAVTSACCGQYLGSWDTRLTICASDHQSTFPLEALATLAQFPA